MNASFWFYLKKNSYRRDFSIEFTKTQKLRSKNFSCKQAKPKPSLKIAPSRSHLLVEKRTILAIWLRSYFFRNKTVLFFKIESWNFQHLFDLGFHETSQNSSSFSSYRQLLFWFYLWVFWMSWNFVRFYEIVNQI